MRDASATRRWMACVLVLAAVGPVRAWAQDAAPVRTLLVGPRETATIALTLRGPQAHDTLVPWRLRVPPLDPSSGTAATLWTDLPITVGTLAVPAGAYRLRLEDGRVLVLAGESGWEGRVTLAEGSDRTRVMGWSLQVVTTRHGEDTVSVGQTRGAAMEVITLGIGPATRSTLRLRWRDRELVVPIAAR